MTSTTGTPATLPMPSAASAPPAKMTHQVPSSNTAPNTSPALHFSTKLMAMPVIICTTPRAIAPSRIMMVSLSGVKSEGRPVQVVSGLIILAICSGASPKKPPVIAPQTVVEMPHQSSSSKKFRMPALGFFLPSITSAAIIMRTP